MQVLLIGATGLLGHNVLLTLVEQRHEVRVLVRQHRVPTIDLPQDAIVETDCIDRDAIVAAGQGCDAIINCAGDTNMSHLRREDYAAANICLPKAIVEAMATMGIKRLVHVSTVNTIGNGTTAQPGTELMPALPPFAGNYYADSKAEGEAIVMEAARTISDAHIVVINPGYMIGPYDTRPSSGKMLSVAKGRAVMVAARGGKAFVDVRDVAVAVVHALERGRNGARYIATNSHAEMSMTQLFRLQAKTMGYRQRVVELPNALVRIAGKVGDGLRALGISTELCSHNVSLLLEYEHYDNRAAVAELGLGERPIAQAIADYFAWRSTFHPSQNKT